MTGAFLFIHRRFFSGHVSQDTKTKAAQTGGMNTKNTANQAPPPIEIFRAGARMDMHGRTVDITTADLAAIAANYNPQTHEAPLVVGHPKTNAPAYGWVKELTVDGDRLLAQPDQVDAAFADLVKAGRYKKVSSSFLLPTAASNPTPGQFYLNHVGFLGAAAPAVKGLRDVQFAASDELVEFAMQPSSLFYEIADLFRRMRDYFIDRDGQEAADKLLPNWKITSLTEGAVTMREPSPSQTAFAVAPMKLDTTTPARAEPVEAQTNKELPMSDENQQPTADFAAREAELASREQALAEREAEAARADTVAFADGLVNDGKLLPREKQTVVELLLTLPADTTVNFAAADGQATTVAAGQAFKDFLNGLPKRVDYAEKTPAGNPVNTVQFAAPAGTHVNADRAELHARAKAYQADHPDTAYLDAVRKVGG